MASILWPANRERQARFRISLIPERLCRSPPSGMGQQADLPVLAQNPPPSGRQEVKFRSRKAGNEWFWWRSQAQLRRAVEQLIEIERGRGRKVNHVESAGGTHDIDMIPYALQMISKLLRWHTSPACHRRKGRSSAVWLLWRLES